MHWLGVHRLGSRQLHPALRAYATGGQADIFDGAFKAAQRDRAALHPLQPDPLLDEVTHRLLDRLEDCTRTFPRALILGGAGAQVHAGLAGGRAGVTSITHVDTSPGMLARAQALEEDRRRASGTERGSEGDSGSVAVEYVLADPVSEELPVEHGQYDVVISCLGLHWVNDVPGLMTQCRLALKPDGLFLAAMLGGTTLQELRIACTAASQEREGGVSPRLSPLAQVRDAGNLLTRAGLAIPAVDVDEISVMYRDPVQLVTHLRGMAEGNALKQRRVGLPRDTALATAAAYIGLFGGRSGDSTGESLEGDEGGDVSDAHEDGVPATFQVVYMTGWAPDPSAQRGAAKRGSATVSFSDLTSALGGKEAES